MEPILEIDGLSVSFTQYDRGLGRRELPVIRELTLAVRPGQVTAVVGASGSGKSLLAHAILGLLPYNSRMEGELRYDGQPLTPRRLSRLRGREIALVPQGVTYLDPLMKVGPQLWGGRRDGGVRRTVRDTLDRYGLGPETEGLYPFELSGGMARRVLIASAVAGNPRLVIADEPTPGLDARSGARVLGHFRELAERGAAVLFITHDLELALGIAHRVAVFYAGEIVEEGAAADFGSEKGPRHPYARALWDAMPQNGFTSLPGSQPYAGSVRGGCRFAPRCPVCREECRAVPAVAYRAFDGGYVRCLYPRGGEEP